MGRTGRKPHHPLLGHVSDSCDGRRRPHRDLVVVDDGPRGIGPVRPGGLRASVAPRRTLVDVLHRDVLRISVGVVPPADVRALGRGCGLRAQGGSRPDTRRGGRWSVPGWLADGVAPVAVPGQQLGVGRRTRPAARPRHFGRPVRAPGCAHGDHAARLAAPHPDRPRHVSRRDGAQRRMAVGCRTPRLVRASDSSPAR